MHEPEPQAASLTELLPLLPDLRELEELRLALMASGHPDPREAQTASATYATIEERVVDAEALGHALERAEAQVQQQITALYAEYRRILHARLDADVEAVVEGLIRLGDQELEHHRYASARRFFETALTHALPLRTPKPRMRALRRIGRVAYRAGELEDACLYYERSAHLAADAGEIREEVIALTGAGNALNARGLWDKAEARYHKALARSDQAEEDLSLQRAQVYINLALVGKVRGDFAAAEAHLEQALSLLSAAEHPADVAFCYHGLAEVRSRQGRYAEAQELCRKALTFPISPYLRAIFASDLAAYHLAAGEQEEARQVAREAEEHAIVSRSPYALGAVYQELGNVHRVEGDQEGWIFFERALELARRYGYRKLEAEILLDYALQRDMMDEHEEARAYRERAAEIFGQMGAMVDEARARETLAERR